MAFEIVQAAAPQPAVRREPGVDLRERLGVDAVPAPLRIPADTDEIGLAQHLQVLRDARLAHVEALDQLADRMLALTQEVEDAPARGLGEDFEDRGHERAVYYQIVICASS